MENIDCKQTTSAAAQQSLSYQDQRLLLIRNVRKHPSLYKNKYLGAPFLHPNEKQQMWNQIAQESGIEKTKCARRKWRALITYLRQHLNNVAQKKVRRYIPYTENPEDKYVKLNDWPYYSELEFIVPYVKYACKNDHQMSPNEIDTLLEGIKTELDRKNEQEAQKSDTENLSGEEDPEDKYVQLNDWAYYSELEFIVPHVKDSCTQDHQMSPNEIDTLLEGIETEVDRKNEQEAQKPDTENLSGEEDPKDKVEKLIQLVSNDDLTEDKDPKDKVEKLIQLVSNDDLTEDDEILKEYFENMLKTTLKLPRCHQNRIKEKLLDTVNECE